MARSCTQCTYYTAEDDQSTCPKCGGDLQFTMLGPAKLQTERATELAEAAWERPEAVDGVDFEIIELPGTVRLGQVAGAIGFFFLARFIGEAFLGVLYAEYLMQEDIGMAVATWVTISVVVYGVAAMLAGGVAGAWSVNWIPQGVGVGLFALPFLVLILFVPESIILYVIIVCVTTPLTVLGAYLGHVLVPPTRIIHS
jgi:hypothetical protein